MATANFFLAYEAMHLVFNFFFFGMFSAVFHSKTALPTNDGFVCHACLLAFKPLRGSGQPACDSSVRMLFLLLFAVRHEVDESAKANPVPALLSR